MGASEGPPSKEAVQEWFWPPVSWSTVSPPRQTRHERGQAASVTRHRCPSPMYHQWCLPRVWVTFEARCPPGASGRRATKAMQGSWTA